MDEVEADDQFEGDEFGYDALVAEAGVHLFREFDYGNDGDGGGEGVDDC